MAAKILELIIFSPIFLPIIMQVPLKIRGQSSIVLLKPLIFLENGGDRDASRLRILKASID